MQTQENRQAQEQEKPVNPDMPPPEHVTPSPEPITPPAEPVTPPSEPVTPPGEPLAQSSNGADTQPPVPAANLEEKIAAAEARAAEMKEAFLRARAEAENLRRRTQEELARAHKFAIEGFAEALVPVKDSLEAALKIDTASMESYKQGVEMTWKQLSAAFEKNRLMEINPSPGDNFDPMLHQAISLAPAEQNANTIVNVLQKGYMIADRLLRPALVTVAEQKREEQKQSDASA